MKAVRTKEYTVDPRVVSRVLGARFRRLYPILLICLVLERLVRNNTLNWVLVFILIWGGYNVLRLELSLRKLPAKIASHEVFAQPMWKEIDEEFFTTHSQDGTFTKNQISTLIRKVERRSDYYVLHVNAEVKGYDFIPLDAFETDSDRQQFEAFLAGKGIALSRKS
jgi:hypothetical protein